MITPANKQDAQKYIDHAHVQRDRALSNLRDISFSQGDNVLILGCGPGDDAAVVATEYVPKGKVLALDIDPEMLAKAKSRFNYPNLEFRQADATNFKVNFVADKVLSFATLSWIPLKKHLDILNCAKESLKPGGQLAMRMTREGDRPFNRILQELMEEDKYKKRFEGYVSPASYQTKERFTEILIQAGLIPLELSDSSREPEFKSKEKLCDWLETWVPEGNFLGAPLKREFLMAAVDKYCQKFFQEEETIVFRSLHGLFVKAQRPV